MQVRSLGQDEPLEEGMATHSSTLAWRIPWTEEPGGYSSWGRKELHIAETTQHTFLVVQWLEFFVFTTEARELRSHKPRCTKKKGGVGSKQSSLMLGISWVSSTDLNLSQKRL